MGVAVEPGCGAANQNSPPALRRTSIRWRARGLKRTSSRSTCATRVDVGNGSCWGFLSHPHRFKIARYRTPVRHINAQSPNRGTPHVCFFGSVSDLLRVAVTLAQRLFEVSVRRRIELPIEAARGCVMTKSTTFASSEHAESTQLDDACSTQGLFPQAHDPATHSGGWPSHRRFTSLSRSALFLTPLRCTDEYSNRYTE